MMTIYKATATNYTYWLTADRSGWTVTEKYFSTKEKANAWARTMRGKWFDFNGKLIAIDEPWKKGSCKVEKIEVE